MKALREAKAYLAVNGSSSQAASILARLVEAVEAAPVGEITHYGSDEDGPRFRVAVSRGEIARLATNQIGQRVRVLAVGEE